MTAPRQHETLNGFGFSLLGSRALGSGCCACGWIFGSRVQGFVGWLATSWVFDAVPSILMRVSLRTEGHEVQLWLVHIWGVVGGLPDMTKQPMSPLETAFLHLAGF